MKKYLKYLLFFLTGWGFLAIIYTYYYKESDFYFSIKYGLKYNKTRITKGIHELPSHFEVYDDDYYSNLITWRNPNPKYEKDSYTHINKMLTIRGEELLLEQDNFKKKLSDDSLNYIILRYEYYYKKEVIKGYHGVKIMKEYKNDKLISVDTISLWQ